MIRDRNQRKQLWLNLRQSASRRPSAPCRRLYLGGNSATIHCDGRLGHCSCTSAPRHQRVTSHAATSWWTADGTGKQRRAKGACYDQRRATIDHPAGHHAGGRAGPVGDLVVVSDSRGAVDLVWHVRAVLPGRQPGRGGRAGGRELLVRRRHPAGGGRPGAGVALAVHCGGDLGGGRGGGHLRLAGPDPVCGVDLGGLVPDHPGGERDLRRVLPARGRQAGGAADRLTLTGQPVSAPGRTLGGAHPAALSLLDHDKGGRFRIGPEGDDYVTKQLYLPDSAILITRFMTPGGVGEVIDFMPVSDPGRVSDRHRLVRVVRCVRGQLRLVFECAPRFDYGRQSHELELTDQGAVFRTPTLRLTLHGGGQGAMQRHGDDVRGALTVRAGQAGGVMLESAADGPPRTMAPDELLCMFNETARFWRGWLAGSTYRGRWREMVDRSAITLKLMTYAPTGALVAAPTAGLPEQVGGERNWDYRFTWIRDASFSVHALLGLGFTDEAAAFGRWLADRAAEQVGQASGPLKIMYRVDGSSDLDEELLDHFEGYAGSKPVRVGNGAADQLQLDIYGEAIDSIYLADRQAIPAGHQGWTQLGGIVNWLCEHWDQPEEGIWETRGGRQDFTYGRLMCWVALDRMVRLANDHGRPADLDRWIRQRDQIYHQIMDKGWNPQRRAVAVDPGRHGHRAGLRQPGVPLRPQRLPGRAARRRGHLLDLHVLVRGRAGALGPPGAGAAGVREDVHLRQPSRPVRRGDRADR